MTNRNVSMLMSILLVAVTIPTQLRGVELDQSRRDADSNTNGRVAELFRAVDENLIDAKFIPQNAAKANLLLRNNTNEVLHIQLPQAFAAVPVLAQFGNVGGQNVGGNDGFNGGGGGGGASQGVGGGVNAGQGQGPGMGQGQGLQFGGLMRIAPGKTRKMKASTVCLEHGKPDPNPRIAYRLIPIEQFSDDVRVARLCAQLARGEIKQKPAQAAAWHLANGLSWDRLAKVNRLQSRYLGSIPYFSKRELKDARTLTASLQVPTDSDDYKHDDTQQ